MTSPLEGEPVSHGRKWKPRRAYLRVLIGDLEEKGQVGVVEGVVQSQQGPVNSAFQQVVCKLFEADGLHPAHHALVGPHHHV